MSLIQLWEVLVCLWRKKSHTHRFIFFVYAGVMWQKGTGDGGRNSFELVDFACKVCHEFVRIIEKFTCVNVDKGSGFGREKLGGRRVFVFFEPFIAPTRVSNSLTFVVTRPSNFFSVSFNRVSKSS